MYVCVCVRVCAVSAQTLLQTHCMQRSDMSKPQHACLTAHAKQLKPQLPACVECSDAVPLITALVGEHAEPPNLTMCADVYIVGVHSVDTKVTCLTSSHRDNANLNSLMGEQCGSSSNTCTSWSGLQSSPMPKTRSDPAFITSQMCMIRVEPTGG